MKYHIYKTTNALLKANVFLINFFIKTNVTKLFKNESSNCVWEYLQIILFTNHLPNVYQLNIHLIKL